MKKIAIVVAMFMLASPAWAVVDVNIIPVPIGTTGDVNITYVADANISGFGLDITVDTGANITAINNFHFGESNSTAKGFGIFPGSIDINSVTGQVDYYGTPAAPNTDPCALGGIGTAGVTIEMGALYEDGYQPDWTGTLCTVTVSADCNITVALNARRGGVVREDFADANTNLPITVPVTVVSLCTVPSIVGGTKAAADAAIATAGLVANGTGVLTCVPLNEVLTQDPAGSTQVTCGSTVDYTYSLYETIVPNILGMTAADANAAIADANLAVGDVNWVTSTVVDINLVVSQDPCGDTQVSCNPTAVNYNLSSGCYPKCKSDYNVWRAAAAPNFLAHSWCWPRQCYGELNNATEVVNKITRWIGYDDLNVFLSEWLSTTATTADINHNTEVVNKITRRVGYADLNIFLANWLGNPLGDCQNCP